MTKTEIKREAQDRICDAIGIAFHRIDEERGDAKLREEMSKQYARIEKLFGYVEFSNTRGI